MIVGVVYAYKLSTYKEGQEDYKFKTSVYTAHLESSG